MSGARDLTDRRLVSVAWAGALALLVIGLLMGVRTEQVHREQTTGQVEMQANILGAGVSAALAFDDRSAIREYVDALRLNREVASAGVYDADGDALVIFQRGGAGPPPKRLGAPGTYEVGHRIAVVRAVTEKGGRLGYVYLETLPEPWSAVLARHVGLGLLTIMAFLMLGVVTAAASRLQLRARLLAESNGRLVNEMAARTEAEAALRQSQKMEALGQLTGGIAHDFNNLLQVVHGAFELIRRKPEDRAKVATWAENGIEAANRGASLTRQLLAFSRSQKLELRPFVVGTLLEEMRDLLARTLGGEIVLGLELGDGDTAVLSDRTQLELAVLNLAINARDAMPDGGRLILSTRVVKIPPGHPVLEADDYIELRARDSGEGMPPAVIARAFDPFFTTKGVGKGTGLGLSQVYGVARQAGGTAEIESEPGVGTTVILLLRRSRVVAEPTRVRDTPHPILAPKPGQTVLVVDDEPQVRALARETLELLGYRVLVADGGETALDMLETVRPDLMLFDFAMPEMSGAELADRARRRLPDVPIVFASGYADTEAAEAALGGQAVFLRKPFDMETLAETLAGLLGAPTPERTP